MAFLNIEKTNYEITGKTLYINYETDELLKNVQLSKDGVEFVDAISFSQSTAMFDLTAWENGDYGNCVLRGHYEDATVATTIDEIVINEGESVEVGISLNKDPRGSVVVTLSSEDANIISMDKTTLTFTATDYNIPQPIVVTGVHNSTAENFSTNILVSTENTVRKTIPVLVNNIDMYYGEIVLPTTSLEMKEGESSSFTVKLDKAPSKDQNVYIFSDSGITLSKTSLTFTPTNYNTSQIVAITSTEDTGHYKDKNITITLSSPNVVDKIVSVTLKNITASKYSNIITDVTSIQLNESSVAQLAIKLDKAPPENQIVTLSKDNNNISLNKTSLTFTPSNYNTYQTVLITGMFDDTSVEDKETFITLSSYNEDINIKVIIKNID